MNEFKFKTAKGGEVTLRKTDEGKYMSVGKYVDIRFMEAGDTIQGYDGDTKIVVPINPQVKKWIAEGSSVKIRGTVKCVCCGNLKYDAKPKEYNCEYCDEPTYHKLVA